MYKVSRKSCGPTKPRLGLAFDRGCKFDSIDLRTWARLLFNSSTSPECSAGDHWLKLFFSGKVFETRQHCYYSFKGSVRCSQTEIHTEACSCAETNPETFLLILTLWLCLFCTSEYYYSKYVPKILFIGKTMGCFLLKVSNRGKGTAAVK